MPFTLIGLVASFIGASIVLSIGEHDVGRIIGFAILFFIPLSLYKPAMGTKSMETSKNQEYFGYIRYFLVSIWGASFSVGTGIMHVLNQTYSFGLTLLEVKGTNKIPAIFKSTLVLSMFAYAGVIDWSLGLIFGAGMMLGSTLGSRFAIKKGDVWLKRILLVTIFILALKLILGL